MILARMLTAIVVGIVPSTIAAQDNEVPPCPRGPTKVFKKGIVEDMVNRASCHLVFRPTGLRLTAVADGSRPDPGRTVVKDSRGRYYSTNADGWELTITVWGADGQYLSSFGRQGGGPGEFVGNHLSLFVDSGDSLHVRDIANWSVFSPDQEFVRRVPSRLMGGAKQTTALLYDGRILASDGHRSTGAAHFRVLNRDGRLDEVFGTTEGGTRTNGQYGHDRAIGYLPGYRTFWAAPSLVGSNEYTLEEWDILGDEGLPAETRTPQRVRSFRRHAPWFVWTGSQHTSPVVRYLHVAEGGLLYVQLWRPSQEYIDAMKRFEGRMTPHGNWTPGLEREVESLAEALTEIVVEVIDTRSAQLLATVAYPVSEVLRGNVLLPQDLFRNEMMGYVYGTDEAGLPYVEIIEGMLLGGESPSEPRPTLW